MDKRKMVYDALEQLDIQYQLVEHEPVYTIDEMEQLGISEHGEVCKNLFLRDAKGKFHYLVVLRGDKQADLRSIAEQIGSSKLSFASPERLEKYLQLEKGSVTPLGVMNDAENAVEVVLDSDLKGNPKLGLHPNENTATVFISYDDLCKYINHFGNTITSLRI